VAQSYNFFGQPGRGVGITQSSGNDVYRTPTLLANALRRQPQSPAFDAEGYVADMNVATLRDLVSSGPNLPGAGDRLAATEAAKRRLEMLAPTPNVTGLGMGPNGAQPGASGRDVVDQGPSAGTNNIPVPVTVEDYGPGSSNDIPFTPTQPINTPPPASNGMAPDGGQAPPVGGAGGGAGGGQGGSGGSVGGGEPGYGGTPAALGSWEGEVPGNWGQFDEFYDTQLGALMYQQQLQREQALSNAIRRQTRQNAQQSASAEPFQADWSWANLPEVRTQTENPTAAEYGWQFGSDLDITPEQTTNQEILNQMNLSGPTMDWFSTHFRDNPELVDSIYWSTLEGPSQLRVGTEPVGARAMNEFRGRLFDYGMTNAGGDVLPGNIPAGYAAPT
jgi:hypothetical protein